MDVTAPPLPRLELAALESAVLDPLTKGLPLDAPPTTLGEIAARGWHLLDGDLPLPAAVIRGEVLSANSAWMGAFAAANGLLLAPHGKTTMAPQLYDRQIADGAWAITVATAQQLAVCRRFGVRRVILANQPVGAQEIDACLRALRPPHPIELYCLVDSLDGLARLSARIAQAPPPADNPLRVLVEMGFRGGRTGIRSREAALDVARAVAAAPGVALAGIECFEGLLPDPDAAGRLVDEVVALGRAVLELRLVPAGTPLVLSAGGTAFFDRVGERLRAVVDQPVIRVLRSGCYLTQDAIAYAAAFRRIVQESTLVLPAGGLNPALEVWAYVQSRPDPDKAILTMGKRDAGFDAGLPVPLRWYRDGETGGPQPMSDGHVVQALNDQHCHMTVPADSPLAVGDMVGFGIGHPCTTFDRWQLLMVVDETYRVTGAVRTFF